MIQTSFFNSRVLESRGSSGVNARNAEIWASDASETASGFMAAFLGLNM